MEGLKELVTASLAKMLNIAPEAVAELLIESKSDGSEALKPGALEAILEKDKARVQKLREDSSAGFDNGYKKGQSETMTKLEKTLRDQYGITSEKQGQELIDEIIKTKTTSSGNIDEDAVKRSPAYQALSDKHKKELADAVKVWEEKYNDRENQLKKGEAFKTVSQRYIDALDKLGAILPTDATKAANLKSRLLKGFNEQFDFDVQGDKILLLNKSDGKLAVDAHGNQIDFEQAIKSDAGSLLDFKVADQRGGSGNNNDGAGAGAGKQGYSGPTPKNAAEYNDFMSKAKTQEEKTGITTVWIDSQKGS